MKDRIKKFYDDHVEAITVFACTITGAAAAGLVIIKMVERDNTPWHIRTWTHKETGELDLIGITRRNGKFDMFDYLPEKP